MLAAESDERLVALARAGDERAFAAIVERYRAPLLRYVRGYLPSAAAEDALQQALINAYSALVRGTAEPPVALRPWLYRVAHNAALNVARDSKAAPAPLPEGLDGVERPDEIVQRSERLRRVVGAVRALPPRQRHVIVRSALEGDSHEQIAADLGVSAGSIRQLAHRARRTVREAAAALLPVPVARWLPWGSTLAESPPPAGGAGAVAKVAAAVVAAAVAGGGAVEVADRAREERERTRTKAVAQAPVERPATAADRVTVRQERVVPVTRPPAEEVSDGAPARGESGRSGSSGPGGGDDSSGPSGTSGPGGGDTSGSGGGDSSGPSDSSGSGTSGGDDSSALSDSSGPGSGVDSSGPSDSSGPGSGGDTSGSSGGDSSGPGSAEDQLVAASEPVPTATPDDSSGSGSSGSGSSGSGSSGSGSSGSGSSGSGSDD